MQSIVDQLKTQMDNGEFESLVRKKLEEYYHLITPESAQYLVALEKLGIKHAVTPIEQAKQKAAPSILHVRVKRVFVPQIFKRGVQESITQRIGAQDESGSCTIVLYDDLAREMGSSAMAQDIIEVGPLKYRGREFHAIPSAKIKRLQKGPRCKLSDKRQLLANFEGKITKVTGDFVYTSAFSNTKNQIATSFEIDDGTATQRVVCWDSGGIEKHLKEGMQIEIEGGLRKNGEIHVGKTSRLLYSRQKESRPKIKRIEIEEEKVLVFSDEKTIVFEGLQTAAHKFGIGSIPHGISPKTALELKVPRLIGKEVPGEWENS